MTIPIVVSIGDYNTWDEFCTKYRDSFGIDEEDEQQQAEKDLQAIRMEPTEELDHFIDRFMHIRRKAGRMDGKQVANKFIKALNPMLNQVVGVAIAGWSRRKRASMTRVIRIAKKMKATLGNNNAAAPREPSHSNGVNQWQRYAENNGGPSRQGGNQDVVTCPFHEGELFANKNHNPATYAEFAKATKAFSRMNLNQGPSGSGYSKANNGKRRFSGRQLELVKKGLSVACEQPYKRGHTCTGQGNKGGFNNNKHNGGGGNNGSGGKIMRSAQKVNAGNINKRIDDLLLESNLPLTNSSLSTITTGKNNLK
ncbi:unnamed protein product [Mucor hiemalis]